MNVHRIIVAVRNYEHARLNDPAFDSLLARQELEDIVREVVEEEEEEHTDADEPCKGCEGPIGDYPALSRYGHGDICSNCGTREALQGDFIKAL